MDEQKYACPMCGKLLSAPKGEAAPMCCGRSMDPEPLPFCTKPPADAESARAADADEPCNDGRGPKKS